VCHQVYECAGAQRAVFVSGSCCQAGTGNQRLSSTAQLEQWCCAAASSALLVACMCKQPCFRSIFAILLRIHQHAACYLA
jgi:hypothetical protein